MPYACIAHMHLTSLFQGVGDAAAPGRLPPLLDGRTGPAGSNSSSNTSNSNVCNHNGNHNKQTSNSSNTSI